MRKVFVLSVVVLVVGCCACAAQPAVVPDECKGAMAGSYWCQTLLHPNQWGGWRHPTN